MSNFLTVKSDYCHHFLFKNLCVSVTKNELIRLTLASTTNDRLLLALVLRASHIHISSSPNSFLQVKLISKLPDRCSSAT